MYVTSIWHSFLIIWIEEYIDTKLRLGMSLKYKKAVPLYFNKLIIKHRNSVNYNLKEKQY